MNEFTNFLQDLRLRRLGETPGEDFLQGNPEPEPEPLEDLVDETPAATNLAFHLANPPEQPRTGVGRGILGVLAGALGGFGQSATAGAALGQGVIEEPHRRAISQYNQKSKGLAGLAEIESQGLNRKRLFEQHREAIRQREEDRRSREEQKQLDREAREDKKTESRRSAIQIVTDAQGRNFWADKDTQTVRPMETEPGKPMMGKVSDKVQKAAQTMDETIIQAEKLRDLVDMHKDTFALGPMQGAPSEWMTRHGVGATPEKADMYRIMKKLANESLYELSGAQINNKEYERLRATLADPNATEVSIISDLNAFIESAHRQRERYKTRGVWSDEAFSGQGETPDFRGTPTPAPKRRYTIERVPQ